MKTDPVFSELEYCRLCGRNCKARRNQNGAGRCGMTNQIVAARAALHMWEEPCISGKEGSGAVFFSGCPLHCIFCQNRAIAEGKEGIPVSVERLSEIFLELQCRGANNINLVTPTHFTPQIIEAVKESRAQGLILPVVWNTGSYETPETIRMLNGTVDVFLPDLKFFDPELSGRYAGAPDYFRVAFRAIREMVLLAGAPVFDENGMMKKGVLVRHMILPGHTKDSVKLLSRLHTAFGDGICISIMNQYTPMPGIGEEYPELGRKVTKREYEKVLDYAMEIGIEKAYYQEGGTAKESFIPVFDGEGILKG